MWPVAHAPDQGMLDWVEMDVINVPREVIFIADCVLPKPPLPERQITIRSTLQLYRGSEQPAAEVSLDPTPTTCKIGIALRQCKDRVEVIGEHHHCVDGERTFATGGAERIPQRRDMIHE
ncbi:hypothetical protein BE61_35910 [Bradyrhizobium elkanii USDA 61]|nr:hypothetical protein BE61_35910 [Bradyrhizobium elkanii USDA 61]